MFERYWFDENIMCSLGQQFLLITSNALFTGTFVQFHTLSKLTNIS